MAEEQKQQPTAQAGALPRTPGDAGQESQVTSQIPATRPVKNPKRVAAGKAVAERTCLARQAQKKAAAEAAIIIANNNGEKNLRLLLSRLLKPNQSLLQLIQKVSAQTNGSLSSELAQLFLRLMSSVKT